MRKTAIIILTYNNLQYSIDCLESIRRYTDKGTYEIIVVDNNSTDGTRKWLNEQKDIKFKLNDINEGFPKGCNIGIKLAEPDSDILLLNNDTIAAPRWLENLRICLHSDEKIGAAGAVCNHNENLQGVGFTYDNLDQIPALAEKNNISNSDRWEEKVFLIGFCLLIKREVINTIGLLDEAYSPGYVEDNDLSLRIISAGYKLMLCHDCFIHHYLGSKFRENLSGFYPILFKNRIIFKSKWGFETRYFDEVKHASLRILNESDRYRHMNILDLGCGIGVTLLKVKYDYPNSVLFGWEPDIHMAKISTHFATVSTKAMNNMWADYDDNFFDYIFVGHYPELVEKPKAFLEAAKEKLKPGGWLIATIQNIMHYDIIRDMLNGKWFLSSNVQNKVRTTNYTLNDFSYLLSESGYRNQFTFHWFSTLNEADRAYVLNLCELSGQEKDYNFSTYSYSIKAQK